MKKTVKKLKLQRLTVQSLANVTGGMTINGASDTCRTGCGCGSYAQGCSNSCSSCQWTCPTGAMCD